MINLKNNRVVKNASWIIVCRILQSLLSLVIGTISARYLGPSNYGLINYASSITAFLVPVVQLGLRSTLVQEIISEPDQEGQTLGTALAMSTIASVLGILGVIAFTNIANRTELDTIVVCSLYSISLVFQALEMIQYWFQAKLLSKYVSIISLVAYALVSLYRVFLLITGKNVYWFALSQMLDYLIISVSLLAIYKRVGSQKLSVSVMRARTLFSKSKYYIVSGIMVTIFSLTDRIMLTLIIGEETTGYYSAAMTCADLSSFVFAAIIDSARPSIFESKKRNEANYRKNISRLYSIIILLALGQSAVLTVGARYIVEILYGDGYIPSIAILRIITWYTVFAYMGSVRNIWLLAEGKQSVLWKVNLLGAVSNIFLNLALIPMFGASGAAFASVFTQFFTNCLLCFLIRPIRPIVKLLLDGINPRKAKELWVK
ncbi:MAG: flippase [Clostridiales bacterium]|nr:flippase [Clostridiales bacterium]